MMMGCRMVFGKVVGVVVFAPFPMDSELILLWVATILVKTHVHGLGLALLYGVVGDAPGCWVVGFHWCGGLGMAHPKEGLTDGTSFLSIVEEASKFGFCGAGHNVAQDVADDVNGAIQRRVTILV
jgi:hypothetical protein